MSTTYKIVQLDAIKPDDNIKATHAESGSVIYGRVDEVDRAFRRVSVLIPREMRRALYASKGWLFEREVKPLILDPGYYFDKDGELLTVHSDLKVEWIDGLSAPTEQAGMELQAPYRRAVPGEEVGR